MLSKRMNDLKPYKPGEQPSDRIYVKLNANENPYPPSPECAVRVKRLLADDLRKMALYPDPDATALRKEIAAHLNETGGVLANDDAGKKLGFKISPDMIFCGNGSDEVLSFLFYAFFDSDKPVVVPEFSYSFYPVYAGYYDIPLTKVPLSSDFSIDADAMVAAAHDSSGLIFANPNAPTGIALSCEAVRKMLLTFPKDKVFVVDEAYADFGSESVLPLLLDFPNLVVVRTFSKSLAFAGMRMGYIVASPELRNAVTTVKNSFNHFPADNICQEAAKAAVSDIAYYRSITKQIVKDRDSFRKTLIDAGYEVLPSATNFVFVRHKSLSGKQVYELVKKEGILIRHFDIPGVEDFVRITIGTAEQMKQLAAVMKNL
ncbi:MAG: histidinol-phosphate transaminase [Treponemataceae bacterium]|nr:histidinol-phosphate transaminase [Treponemataceae bacterium]